MQQLLDIFTKLSIEKKIGILLVAVVLVVVLDYLLVASGQLTTKAELLEKQDKLKITLMDKQQKAKNLGEFKREVERLKQRLREAEEQLPKKSEIPKLLKDIAYEGQQSGLTVTTFEARPESNSGTFAKVPVAMSVQGGYHEIAVFLDRLSKLPRIVNVTDFKLSTPKEVNKKVVLTCTYLATTYRFLSTDEQKASSAPAAKKSRRRVAAE